MCFSEGIKHDRHTVKAELLLPPLKRCFCLSFLLLLIMLQQSHKTQMSLQPNKDSSFNLRLDCGSTCTLFISEFMLLYASFLNHNPLIYKLAVIQVWRTHQWMHKCKTSTTMVLSSEASSVIIITTLLQARLCLLLKHITHQGD